MRPMEKHRYITTNEKICKNCNKSKKLKSFWNKENDTIEDTCKTCQRVLLKKEITSIVLNVLTNNSL